MDAGTPVSIVNGFFSINGASFTPSDALINSGDNIQIKANSPSQYGHTSASYLTVGTLTREFTLTTTSTPDFTPNSFEFTAQYNVEPTTYTTSNSVTINGIDSKTPISISSGQYSINGGAYISAESTINSGDSIVLKLTSSDEFSSETIATLTVGSVSGSFSATTRAKDTTPNYTAPTPVTNAEPNQAYDSGEILFNDFDGELSLSLYAIGNTAVNYNLNNTVWNGGSNATLQIQSGDKLELKVYASESYEQSHGVQVTGLNVDFSFLVTTKSDVAPVVTITNTKMAKDNTVLLLGSESIMLSFSESMSNDLELTGGMLTNCNSIEDCIEQSWNPDQTELTLIPKTETYWPVGLLANTV